MNSEAIRHLVIRGRVQGVGYRAFTEYTALDHGLGGWVRNRRDGAVEAVFAGPLPAVTAMRVEASAIQKLCWIEESQDSEPSRLA